MRKGLLDSITYGNGQSIAYQYDAGNRLKYELTGERNRFEYAYDAKGNLAQVGDYRANLWTKYVYDFGGKPTNLYDTWGRNSFFAYDNAGKITKIEEDINNNKFVTKYQYGDFNNLVKVLFGTNSSITYNYNEAGQNHTLGRLNSAEIKAGETLILNSKLTFEPGGPGTGSTTSNRVSRIDNNGKTIDYTFDMNGNIKTITYEKGKANEKITEYFYDDLNQLLRENNQTLNKTIKYNYDNGGNILSKEEYAHTTDETLTDPSKVSAYTYDSVWKDKLTSYGSNPITSDEIGNTTGYDGWTLTWDRGRELASMSGNGKALSFTYNENGIRTTKTVDGITTKYYLIGDAVAYESNDTDNIYYTYGADNNLISMNLNGEEYYYVRNAQNDIIGLIDSIGTEVVRYTYDTWGKLISITDKDGNDVTHDTTHIGYKNPYRYRGYRYDNETGLYYLQSRYYNPDWGRFINADSIIGVLGLVLSHNMFAYCINNPVNSSDPSGKNSEALRWAYSNYQSFASADGSYPYGDILGGIIIGGAAVYVGVSWLYNKVSKNNVSPQPPTPFKFKDWKKNGGPRWNPYGKIFITTKALEEVWNKWGQKGVDAFCKAAQKGFVDPRGANGIKTIFHKFYDFEIKVTNSQYGDWRIYGYINKVGEYIFDKFGKGLH